MQKGFEKRFKNGDIVYWCHQNGHNYSVKLGMVDEQFSDVVCMDYLSPIENRKVNGIPIDEFKNEDRYKKLPKGWTYNTRLFEMTYDDVSDGDLNKYINGLMDSDGIKRLYDKGLLVKDCTKFHGVVEEEITKDGYRVIKKYPMWHNHISNVSVRSDKVYFTYDEAQQEVDEHIAEFNRQANLSEYEWSLEQIEKTINRYIFIQGETDKVRERYKDLFINMSNLEDIETRIFDGNIQWKYWKNKRWSNIEL